MEYWIVFDAATGAPLYPGSGSPESSAYQQLPEGAAIVAVPQQVLTADWPNLNLAPLRVSMAAQVDAQAEAVRANILTPGSAQAMTYMRKESEARAWLADPAVATPFLAAEAPARGMTIEALATEVVALADAWVTVGAAIEGARMGAKATIAAATTLSAIVAARNIDWSGFHA